MNAGRLMYGYISDDAPDPDYRTADEREEAECAKRDEWTMGRAQDLVLHHPRNLELLVAMYEDVMAEGDAQATAEAIHVAMMNPPTVDYVLLYAKRTAQWAISTAERMAEREYDSGKPLPALLVYPAASSASTSGLPCPTTSDPPLDVAGLSEAA